MAFLNSGLPNFRVNLSYKSDGIRPNKCDCVKACHNMKRYLCNQCNTRTCFIDFIMALNLSCFVCKFQTADYLVFKTVPVGREITLIDLFKLGELVP